MATFTTLDQEKLAEADKHELRKANTLGSDRSVVEEPFGNSDIVLREDIFSETPTASTNFASPDYGDWPLGDTYDPAAHGTVASRRIKMRLHPLVTSGITGPSSVQTFLVVSASPASDSFEDIEAVRIKHLVPPDLSQGRANAAHPDQNFRGFELALFPAQSGTDEGSGAYLDAYDGYYSIPVTADPTAANGMGTDARWTVDYANGIVRFSSAPLNGLTGVMNPFNVYGDINGQEITSAAGRVTMYATFYQYVGPHLIDSDDVGAVTVGDGTNSFGTYYGPTSSIMQQAVDSLATIGGTVYLKEGDYTYERDVEIPDNVSVVALSKRAWINRPSFDPAFTIQGSNAGVSGLTVKTVPPGAYSTASRAAIEISARVDLDTVENVTIKNNTLWATHDAYGVGFAPGFSNSTFRNIMIEDNIFDSSSDFPHPVYIGEAADDNDVASVTLDNVRIHNNDFRMSDASVDGYAILIQGRQVEEIRELHITDNHCGGNIDIGIDAAGVMIENLYVANNSEFRNMYVDSLSGAIIENNVFTDAHLDGYITDSQFNNNILNAFTLYDTVNDFVFTGNTCFGKAQFKADNALSENEICNVVVSNNKFHQDLSFSEHIVGPGGVDHNIKNLVIENNSITMSLNFATSAKDNGSGAIRYVDLRVVGNVIGDPGTTNVDSINFGNDAATYVYLNGCEFSDNTMHGNVVFYQRTRSESAEAGVRLLGNTFIGAKGVYLHSHRMNKIAIDRNRLQYIDLFSDPYSYSAPESISGITIKDNSISATGVIRLHDVTDTSGFVLNNCTIEDNVFDSTGSIDIMDSGSGTNDYTFNDMSVSGNKLPSGSIDIGGTLDSGSSFNSLSIKNNYVNGALSIAGAITTDLHATGNFAGTLSIGGALFVGHVTDNITFSLTFSDSVDGSVIVDNIVNGAPSGLLISGAVSDTTLSSNNISGFLTLSSTCTDSEINGNLIDCDPAGTGIVTFGSTMTRVTVNGNRINGAFTSGDWIESTLSGNSVLDAFTAVSWNRCNITDNLIANSIGELSTFGWLIRTIMSGSTFSGPLTVTTLSASRIESNVIGGAVTISSLAAESSFSNNTVEASLDVTATVTDSTISGNNIATTAIITGLITNATISGNTSQTLNLLSTTTGSSITGNVAYSTGTPVALVTGTLLDCVVSGNVFKSESATAAMVISVLTDTKFSNNVLLNAAAQNITIGDSTRSSISNCDFTCATLIIGDMDRSSLSGSTVIGNFSMSESTILLDNSNIIDNVFNGTVSMISTSTTTAALSKSSFSNNTVTSTFTMNSGNRILENSTMNGNKFVTVAMDINGPGTSHLVFDNSTFNDNTISSEATFTGQNARGTYAIDSVIDGNAFGGGLSFAEDLVTTTVPGQFILNNTTFSNNHIHGNTGFGPANRAFPTYSASSISGNTVQDGSFTLNGIATGCSIGGNTIDNDTNFDELRGCTVTGNIFGADGTGVLTFTATGTYGGLKEGTIFNGNVCKGRVIFDPAITTAIDASTISDNGFDGGSSAALPSFVASTKVTSSVINDNRFADDMTFLTAGSTIDETSISGNVFSSGDMIFNGSVDSSVLANNVLDHTVGSMTFNASVGSGGDKVTISGNKCYIMQFSNVIPTLLAISGNSIQNLIFDLGLTYSSVTGNSLLQLTFSAGSIYYSSISSNVVVSTATLGSVQRSSITGNHFHGTFSATSMLNAEMGSNNFDGTVGFSGAITNSSISGNHFQDPVTLSSTTNYSTISVNAFYDTLLFSGTSTGLVYSGNSHEDTPSNVTFATMVGCTIDGNQFAGTLTTGALIDTSIVGNVNVGAFLCTTVDDSVISGNRFTTSTFGMGAANNVVIIGNNIEGLVTITSITGGSFSNNVLMAAGSNTIGPCTDCGIGDNHVTGTLAMTSLNECAMDGNKISTALTFSGVFYRSVLSGNSILVLTIGGQTTESSVSSNTILGVATFTGWFTDVTMVGNTFKSNLILPAVNSSQFVISDNHVGGTVSNGLVDTISYNGMTMSGNTFDQTLTLHGRIYNSAITGNSVTGDVSFDSNYSVGNDATIQESVISGNTFVAGFAVNYGIVSSGTDASIYEVVFTGNYVGGVFGITTTDDYCVWQSIISDNTFGDSFTITSADANMTALIDSVISDNIITGAIVIDNTSNGAKACTTSMITGNKAKSSMTIAATLTSTTSGTALDGCIISGNSISGSVTMANASRNAGTQTYLNSVISNNVIGGTLTLNGYLNTSAIEGNQIIVGFSTDNINDTGINNNRVGGATNIGAVSGGRISNNNFVSAFSSGALTDCTMLGNIFDNTASLSTLVGVTISGNQTTSTSLAFTFTGSITDTIIDGNDFSENVVLPTGSGNATIISDSVFSNNHVGGVFNGTEGAYQYMRFNITGNIIDGNVTFGNSFSDSIISDNIISGAVSMDTSVSTAVLGVMIDTILSGNKMGSFSMIWDVNTGSSAGLYRCVVSDNLIDGTFTLTTAASAADSDRVAYKTTFKGNTFGGAVLFDGNDTVWGATIERCTIVGNVFDSTFTVTSSTTNTVGPFREITFSGNVCENLVSFTSEHNGNSIFEDGSFTGNWFDGGLQIGNPTQLAHHFTRITISGNTGTGGVSLYTAHNSNMTGVVITGNAMNGTLHIGKSGTTTYTSPPGADDPMIALNRFGAYTGITFTADRAIGWHESGLEGTNSDFSPSNLIT